MLSFKIRLFAMMNHAAVRSYTTPTAGLGFSLQGLRYHRTPGYDLVEPDPMITFLGGGTPLSFEFTTPRESWAIMLETDDVRRSVDLKMTEVRCEGRWVRLPSVTMLTPESVPAWQTELMRMREAYRNPDPKNELRVMTGVINIIRYIIDQQPDTLGASPASKLRRLIDEDETLAESLAELSRRCRYSPDHLRTLFEAAYGVTPQAYRNRKRLARVMELLANSELSVKEIAAMTGFRHVSHLSSVCRASFGLSPSQCIKRFRHDQGGRV